MVSAQRSCYFHSCAVLRPFNKPHPYQRLGSGCSTFSEPDEQQDCGSEDYRSEPAEQNCKESVKYYKYTYVSQAKSSKLKSSLSSAARSVRRVARVAANVLVVSVVCVGCFAGDIIVGCAVRGLLEVLLR